VVAEFRVLGPLEVCVDGHLLDLGGAVDQRITGTLLLSVNQPVSIDRLMMAAWDGQPPRTARRQVQNRIGGLRTRLARAGPRYSITTSEAGYHLRVPPDELDATRFDRLVQRADEVWQGDPAGAVDALREASGLWRGTLLAGLGGAFLTGMAATWEEKYLAAVERRTELELALGRHGQVATDLTDLVSQHPLREPLIGQLMLTLYRCGRHSEALAVYQRLRVRLADELGVDPGPELRRLHQAILRQDPALQAPEPQLGSGLPVNAFPTGPHAVASAEASSAHRLPTAQLPPDVAAFTGRIEYLSRLDALLDDLGNGPPAALISVIAGMAGVGKTALAVHWAHRVRHRFPDGQLHINLQGFAQSPPIRPIDALTRFLHALGGQREQIPADLDEATGLYRSLIADKRMLVLLDNAADAEQIRPLLPASPGSLVLVTSRNRLTGLVARDGAHRIDLDLLSTDEARALLARTIDAGRVNAEPDACADLARACTCLPLALRIAAAHLADRPHCTISQYLAQLTTGDRLSALSVMDDDQAAVRATFDLSYGHLPPTIQRVFRLLGLVPGPDVTADAAAALVDGDAAETGMTLDRLESVHLLDQPAPGRYRFHDLLRSYATERAHAEDSDADRRAAVERLFHWYLHTADRATRLLHPEAVRLSPTPGAPNNHARLTDQAACLAWLDAERANLVVVAHHAAAHGPRRIAWLLVDALRGYFAGHIHTMDWLTTAHAAAEAAESDNDRTGEAVAQLNLADALRRLSQYEQAIAHYHRALALSQEVGWLDGQATALANVGGAYLFLGRLPQAAHHLSEALRIGRQTTRRGGEASRLNNLGVVYWQQGQLEQSAAHYHEAVVLRIAIGSEMDQAASRSNLAEVYHALGRLGLAHGHLACALDLHRQAGKDNADALRVMAALHRDAHRNAEAVECAQAAVALAGGAEHDPRTEAHALVTLGTIRHQLGQHEAAIDLHRRAFGLSTETGNRFPQTEALIGLAAAQLDRDQPAQANRHANDAVAIARDTGYRMLEGQALTILAQINLYRRRNDEAVDHAQHALAIHRETGHRLGEARTLLVLGRALAASASVDAARDVWRQAHKIFDEIGVPEADDARLLLSTCLAYQRLERPAARPDRAHTVRP
jgi:DNA-binding SARP family transcriptional activator/tetratricopeptide (TPR) repeat protein